MIEEIQDQAEMQSQARLEEKDAIETTEITETIVTIETTETTEITLEAAVTPRTSLTRMIAGRVEAQDIRTRTIREQLLLVESKASLTQQRETIRRSHSIRRRSTASSTSSRESRLRSRLETSTPSTRTTTQI